MSVRRWTLLFVVLGAGLAEAGPYDPALRFSTYRTPHFRIHVHRGEEALAARLALIAEATHVRLSTAWGLTGSRMTDVVVVDQADLSNGSATVIPRNQIVIYPVPPGGGASIGNSNDWLEYVFTHEYAHVLHLDRSRGWARAAKALFGRSPIAFPNLTLPLWQIEGLATFTESERGMGRLHDGDFREVVDSGVRHQRFEPLDRVNGGLVDWPSGQGWYAYGARFHQFLADRYGVERLHALSARTAGRFPFLTSGAFAHVYGKPLDQLWREFRDSLERATPSATDSERLTSFGFLVDGPRASRDGALHFTVTDPHRFPGIYRLMPGSSAPERVVSRYGGETLSIGSGVLIFDQLEFVRGAALVSDLHAYDLTSRRTRRLTSHARLVEADLSPDGTRLAAIQVVAGARSLVILDAVHLLASRDPFDVASLRILSRAGDADEVLATPRWSPDGRVLAVERRRRGGPSAIALLDAATLAVTADIRATATGRVVQPAFSPDGSTLYFAATDGDAPFAVRAVAVDRGTVSESARTVLSPEGGARWPVPTGNGRLVYVGYTPAGSDLFAAADQPGQPDQPNQPIQPNQPDQPDETRRDSPQPADPGSAYSPLPSVFPRGWMPLVEHRDDRWRIGGAAVGIDVLERHVVSASGTWAVTGGNDLAPQSRPDWDAAYTYQRWQPSFYLAARDRTTLFDAVTSTGALVPVSQREQTLDVGVWRSIRRVRWVQTALVAYHLEGLTQTTAAAQADLSRAGVRASWSFTSARRYGYSISDEDGFTLAATGEFLRPGLGSDGDADAATLDARAYLPLGLPHAVLAIRGAMATASGDDGVRRRFRLGGSDGNPVAGAFGSDAISLLRGFQHDVFVGDRVALTNLEARVPLAQVQRGWGTWPIFVRSIHATGFFDVGHAWTGEVTWADRKLGYGVEVSADVVAGFGLPLTCTAGVAWGRDGADTVADTRSFYFRVGRSF